MICPAANIIQNSNFASQIGLSNSRILRERCRGSVHDNMSLLKHVSAVRLRQRKACILLHK